MIRSFGLLISLLILALSLSGCAEMNIQNFKAGVTLPYSEDCYFKYVLTPEHVRFEKTKCDEMKKRSLIITSDDWKIIRKNFQDNCQVLQCKQLVGQFDQLFLVIDKNLQLIPWK